MTGTQARLQDVTAAFEAALLRPLLAPLERACGPLAGAGAFTALLRRSLERDDAHALRR